MKIAKLTIAILLSVALLLLAGCGGEKKQEQKPAEKPKAAQTLKVGMDAAYPPFGSQDVTSKEYVGFDVDVIKAIGAAEGFNVTIHNIPFDGLIPALQAGNIDVAINDITINEDRAKSVDFSKRYFNQLNEAFLELKNSGVDAVINDIPTNEYYVNTSGKNDVKTVELALTREDLGIAVKKGNKELLGKINSGLQKIKKNGEFTKLYQKWFGKEPSKELLAE